MLSQTGLTILENIESWIALLHVFITKAHPSFHQVKLFSKWEVTIDSKIDNQTMPKELSNIILQSKLISLVLHIYKGKKVFENYSILFKTMRSVWSMVLKLTVNSRRRGGQSVGECWWTAHWLSGQAPDHYGTACSSRLAVYLHIPCIDPGWVTLSALHNQAPVLPQKNDKLIEPIINLNKT